MPKAYVFGYESRPKLEVGKFLAKLMRFVRTSTCLTAFHDAGFAST